MKAAKEKVVTIDYILRDDEGTVLDSSEINGTLSYIHGTGAIVPGLETRIEGKSAGESFHADLMPEDAYGIYNPELVFDVPKNNFEDAEELEEGMQFQAEIDDELHILTIKDIKDDSVTVDANHPLAGQELHFDISILEVRDASAEEIAHGHVHDENDSHHNH